MMAVKTAFSSPNLKFLCSGRLQYQAVNNFGGKNKTRSFFTRTVPSKLKQSLPPTLNPAQKIRGQKVINIGGNSVRRRFSLNNPFAVIGALFAWETFCGDQNFLGPIKCAENKKLNEELLCVCQEASKKSLIAVSDFVKVSFRFDLMRTIVITTSPINNNHILDRDWCDQFKELRDLTSVTYDKFVEIDRDVAELELAVHKFQLRVLNLQAKTIQWPLYRGPSLRNKDEEEQLMELKAGMLVIEGRSIIQLAEKIRENTRHLSCLVEETLPHINDVKDDSCFTCA